MYLRFCFVIILMPLCTGCYGQNAGSKVQKWWYTETPQGYTEQGTAINPVASQLPVAGGNKGTLQGDKR